VENSVCARGGGEGEWSESKKKCSKLTDDISAHCSLLDAAAVLASSGLVPPWHLLSQAPHDFEGWRSARAQVLMYL